MCETQCLSDCNYSYYTYETKITQRNDNHYDIIISLFRSGFPDIVIEYMPEMTFISLVCNFGGLLGMWLGLSIMSIMDKIMSITKKYFINKLNIIIISKLNFNIINPV